MEQGLMNVTPAKEIFVVDDDPDVRNVLAATLAPEGLPVIQFEDGDSFLKEASARVPICIFLDLVLPKRSGLEILKDLRARDYCAPIFLMSARADPPLVVEAIKNGALARPRPCGLRGSTTRNPESERTPFLAHVGERHRSAALVLRYVGTGSNLNLIHVHRVPA